MLLFNSIKHNYYWYSAFIYIIKNLQSKYRNRVKEDKLSRGAEFMPSVIGQQLSAR